MSEHRARKRFGQHFLKDTYIIHRIIDSIDFQAASCLIEIGPGLAALTQPLAERVEKLHVIEIDRDIVQHLPTLPFASRLQIHHQDVLNFDFSTIEGKKTIVGNLPYNISTPLLFRLAEYAPEIDSMVFMLQKEVVERMCAQPNHKSYGRLSVMLQYFFDMEYLFDVPPSAFEPPPKVDSAIVRLQPRLGRIGLADNQEHFSHLISAAFAMRRKTIRNNLKTWADDATLASVGIDANCRAENIAPEHYVALSNQLIKKE